jgi:hypothetical protein
LLPVSTLIGTGLDALANNGLALGAAYNNVLGGGGGDGYTLCDLELVVSFATAPAANSGIAVWLLGSTDGTSYEDGSSSVTPARGWDVLFPLRPVSGAQRIVRRAWLPWGMWKPLALNQATGQPFAATGNLLRIRPVSS